MAVASGSQPAPLLLWVQAQTDGATTPAHSNGEWNAKYEPAVNGATFCASDTDQGARAQKQHRSLRHNTTADL
jgi:hypothetical protein